MNEIIKINDDGKTVNARDLWKALEVKHNFRDWISNLIRDYGFKEGQDFRYFFSVNPKGRPSKDYAIELDVAKEMAMISKTPNSHKIRKYFIAAEKKLRSIYSKTELKRLAGIEARKSMTDTIKELGVNEKMHGFAYSNFTKLVYKKLGIEFVKDPSFRDKLSEKELKMIETMEGLIKNYLELGYDYSQIKETLPDILIDKINLLS